jgi:hypothetical protein
LPDLAADRALQAELAALKEAFAKSSRNSSVSPLERWSQGMATEEAVVGTQSRGQIQGTSDTKGAGASGKGPVCCSRIRSSECAGLPARPRRTDIRFESYPVEPIVTEYQQHRARPSAVRPPDEMGKLPEGVSSAAARTDKRDALSLQCVERKALWRRLTKRCGRVGCAL